MTSSTSSTMPLKSSMAAKLLLMVTTLLSSMASTTMDFVLDEQDGIGRLHARRTRGSVKLVTNRVFDLAGSTSNRAMTSIRRQPGSI